MRTRLTTLMVLVACALGACGDDSSKDDKQLRSVLKEGLTSTDPDICTRLATPAFLAQTTGKRGQAALGECRKDAVEEADAESISVQSVDVSGDRADADVSPKGGDLPFKSVSIGLRKVDGQWKFDQLKGGTLDRAAFFRLTRKELSSPPGALDDDSADCVLRDFKAVSDEAIVRSLVKRDQRLFAVAGVICGARRELERRGAPARVVTCVARRVRIVLTTGAIGRSLSAVGADAREVLNQPRVERAVRRVAATCAASPDEGPSVPADGQLS